MLENSRRDFHTRKKCDCVSLNLGGFSRNWQRIVQNGQFSAKIHHKSGLIRERELSKNRTADLRPSASHVSPP